MAAVLAGGEAAALSHLSAADLWGIRPSEAKGTDVTTSRKLRSRAGLRFRYSSLPADEATIHNGIPVTTVPRTLLDLAGIIPRRQLARALNQAEIRRLWDSLSLADLLRRHPRRPGAAAIRALIGEPGIGITRSELEDLFLDFIDANNLPRPIVNLPLKIDGVWVEADCVWLEQRLVVELDGHAFHGTTLAYEDDRARDRALTAAGWRVMRITWRQLHDEPEAVVRDLRTALSLRS
jgi:hypothetical protein